MPQVVRRAAPSCFCRFLRGNPYDCQSGRPAQCRVLQPRTRSSGSARASPFCRSGQAAATTAGWAAAGPVRADRSTATASRQPEPTQQERRATADAFRPSPSSCCFELGYGRPNVGAELDQDETRRWPRHLFVRVLEPKRTSMGTAALAFVGSIRTSRLSWAAIDTIGDRSSSRFTGAGNSRQRARWPIRPSTSEAACGEGRDRCPRAGGLQIRGRREGRAVQGQLARESAIFPVAFQGGD